VATGIHGSGIQNLESKTLLDYLSWGEWLWNVKGINVFIT